MLWCEISQLVFLSSPLTIKQWEDFECLLNIRMTYTSFYIKKKRNTLNHTEFVFSPSEDDQRLKLKRNSSPEGLNTNPAPSVCSAGSEASLGSVLRAGGLRVSACRWYTPLQRGSDTHVTLAVDIAMKTHSRAIFDYTRLHLGELIWTVCLSQNCLTQTVFLCLTQNRLSLTKTVGHMFWTELSVSSSVSPERISLYCLSLSSSIFLR